MRRSWVRIPSRPANLEKTKRRRVASDALQHIEKQAILVLAMQRDLELLVRDSHLPARSGSKLRKCNVFLSRFGSRLESTVKILFGLQDKTDHLFL